MSTFGILLAAGRGLRLGSSMPKAFVALENQPIVLRSFNSMIEAGCLKNIVVTVPIAERLNPVSQEMEQRGAIVIPGGETRQQSVFMALRYLHTNFNNERLMNSFVLIHDAARCFVSPGLIQKTAAAVREALAVTTGVRSIDSLKRVAPDGSVAESIRRDEIWQVQTPQAFRFDLIWQAHQEIHLEATDDASLVEKFHAVKMIEGERGNIKVTTAADLAHPFGR